MCALAQTGRPGALRVEDEMKVRVLVVVAAVALVMGGRAASAHHSFAAEFDAAKPFKMTGTVTKVEWQNPHTFFYIDVTDEKGKVTNWAMEMGSPNGLSRAGWTRNTMKAGDKVTVEGSLAKDGSPVGNARSVTLAATGKRLFAASSQATNP
jgi:hypothetical protein